MAQHRDSARGALLDAFQELLVETGGTSATLDEVAKRAGVTKGGLLYHFASRKVLEGALLDRLEELLVAEYDRMRSAPHGAAAYYVSLAEYINSPLDRATLAVGHLVTRNERAQSLVRTMRRQYFQLLFNDLHDAALARATMLIADGLYWDAVTVGEQFEDELDVVAFLDRMRTA
ncbi:MAG TPA: helix-turn-helix domain-containing protein [Glaciihabitans sp.]|jgi:AcrR family transcriptional regulator|nr:helix-turn-helix domain-containing protein [Glaciihabitans sp.]